MRFVLGLVAVSLLAIVVSGCASFSGPGELNSDVGEFRGPGELRHPAYNASAAPIYSPKGRFSLVWPVEKVVVNQEFNPGKRRRAHLGIDLGGRKGTPILAAHEGRVIYAGRAFRTYGKMVMIEYDHEWATLYAHLDKIHVKQGQNIAQGQSLGTMGRTGRATGVHLHFELLRFKQPVDPLEYLQQYDRIVGN